MPEKLKSHIRRVNGYGFFSVIVAGFAINA